MRGQEESGQLSTYYMEEYSAIMVYCYLCHDN